MEKKFIATIGVSEQVSEDSWKYRHRSLEINGSTTIDEIVSWCVRLGCNVSLPLITISELEQLPTTLTPTTNE